MFERDATKLVSDLAKVVLDEPDPQSFITHIAVNLLSSIECRGAILGVIQREGFLDLKATYGYEDSSTENFMRIPLWTPLPITEAIRTAKINVYKSTKEVIKNFPSLSNFPEEPSYVTVSAPIIYRNTVIGAFGFTSEKSPYEGFENDPATIAILSLCAIFVKSLREKKETAERPHAEAMRTLTARQKQIINLFERELTTDQMADMLRYSPSTIKQDIIKIYDIFGVNSRSAVLDIAKKIGLLGKKS
jgi:DNA-binding CsgD family transcriptional regulator